MEELKTSAEWLKEIEKDVTILDGDGWNRQNYEYSFYQEMITKKEFYNRLSQSTIQWNISKL